MSQLRWHRGKPLYDQEEEVVLSGVVRYTTVGDSCQVGVTHDSAYLELDVDDADIPQKKPPSTPPTDG